MLEQQEFSENPAFLAQQLITYIGNKRLLLPFIGNALNIVKQKLQKEKLSTFDVFSGSGVVSRFLKQYSSIVYANDLEEYAAVINQCYLTNKNTFNFKTFDAIYSEITEKLHKEPLKTGIIAELYAPKNDEHIQKGERVFYTSRNAAFLDTVRTLIETVPAEFQPYLLAPLFSEASIHANTAGVFKGFYKDSSTGIGHFGGRKQDALPRIQGSIQLKYPLFSNYTCDYTVLTGDANTICSQVEEVDLAYLDPPYNQHPYGSNYFMLTLLLKYKKPAVISPISGIPSDWNRSNYNKKHFAYNTLSHLVEQVKAKYVLISFNSEGFISLNDMTSLLKKSGTLTVLETPYTTFRASRNLHKRSATVTEYVYLLEKK